MKKHESLKLLQFRMNNNNKNPIYTNNITLKKKKKNKQAEVHREIPFGKTVPGLIIVRKLFLKMYPQFFLLLVKPFIKGVRTAANPHLNPPPDHISFPLFSFLSWTFLFVSFHHTLIVNNYSIKSKGADSSFKDVFLFCFIALNLIGRITKKSCWK